MMFVSHLLDDKPTRVNMLIDCLSSIPLRQKTFGVKTCNQTNIPGLQIYSRPIKRDDIRSSASAFVTGEGA